MTILLILAMGLITFFFRAAPLLLIKESQAEKKTSGFLDHLPLAVLSALTVPGIFYVDKDSLWVGVAAGTVAVILVLTKKVPLFGVIAASVAVAVLVKMV